MKKQMAVAFAMLVAVPSMSFAVGGNHPMAGCGLGYVLFGNQDNSKIKQVFAATLNGIGTQTFGISSGTSGCTEDGAVKFVKEAEVFAEVNLDSLRREMAAGRGEYVDAFATLLGAKENSHAKVVQLFRSEYSSLFPTPNTSSAELMNHISSILAQHTELIG